LPQAAKKDEKKYKKLIKDEIIGKSWVSMVPARGERQKEVSRPDFNQAILPDFPGVQVTSAPGFILLPHNLRLDHHASKGRNKKCLPKNA
jgi:hypothetical protein